MPATQVTSKTSYKDAPSPAEVQQFISFLRSMALEALKHKQQDCHVLVISRSGFNRTGELRD